MVSGLGNVVHSIEALRRQFPHVDVEVLQAFNENRGPNVNSPLDRDIVSTLAEMQLEAREVASAGSNYGFFPTRICTLRRGSDAGVPELVAVFEGGSDPPRIGTVLVFEGLSECVESLGVSQASLPTDNCKSTQAADELAMAVAVPTGPVFALEWHTGSAFFHMTDYGMHEIRLQAPGGDVWTCRIPTTSHLGDFGAALDRFHDASEWVWDGGWTDALEDATVGLLSALDDHFEEMQRSMQASPLGQVMISEIAPSRRRLEGSLANVLEDHSPQALGRVYGAVRSLLSSHSLLAMFGPMFGGFAGGPLEETDLYKQVVSFEKARFAAASEGKRAEVRKTLANLISTGDSYVAGLQDGQAVCMVEKWRSGVRETLVTMRDDPGAIIHPMPFQSLRGEGAGYLEGMMKTMTSSFSSGIGVRRSETIEGLSYLSPQTSLAEGCQLVSKWSESLIDDSISFGTPMSPFEVHGNDPWVQTVMASITSLLTLGFGYVSQAHDDESPTSKVVALLGRDRATLPLNSPQEFLRDRSRKDRLKDVCRVVRASMKKGQRLSLSVNTDFNGALAALKEHHADNWVGSSLQSVWKKMLPETRVCAFELWLHEGPDVSPKLIAADFGHSHSHGRAYYVATRFFDRSFRNLQPGFILAFAEAEYLRRSGFLLWDLGGADKSPMMQYKPQVAIEMDLSDFLRRLRECQVSLETSLEKPVSNPQLPLFDVGAAPPHGGGSIATGVVFENIKQEDLWGAVGLFALEQKLKEAADIAKQESKRIQKPPRAARKAAKTRDVLKSATDENAVAVEKTGDVNAQSREAAKKRYMEVFQRLLAEGASQQDAAVQALKSMAS